MMKIYVTGALTQAREIKLIANALIRTKGNDVKYVKSRRDLNLEEYIKTRYEYIDWCDVIYILKKENGELCDGVVYEKVYAEKQNKEIWFIG